MSDPDVPRFGDVPREGPGAALAHESAGLASDGRGMPQEYPPAPTSLEDLRAELAAEVATPPTTLAVPTRPGYSVRYSTELPGEILRAWAARTRLKDGSVDTLRQALTVLTNQCEAILKNGEPIGEGGGDITFANKTFQQLIGATDAPSALRRFYGQDGLIIAHAEAVVEDAGYGAQVERVDPTRG